MAKLSKKHQLKPDESLMDVVLKGKKRINRKIK